MPEPLLLNISRSEFVPLDRAAQQGDAEAQAFFDGLWSAYAEQEIPCWLCSQTVPHPPFTFFTADPADETQQQLLALPLCGDCHQLPKLYKAGRVFKLFKRMYKSRRGKTLAFHFLS
jgi:hypothetical protein